MSSERREKWETLVKDVQHSQPGHTCDGCGEGAFYVINDKVGLCPGCALPVVMLLRNALKKYYSRFADCLPIMRKMGYDTGNAQVNGNDG